MYKEIFMHVCEAYVSKYKDNSFEISFDGEKQKVIGSGGKLIKANIKDAEKTLENIFMDGSIGLGESYCRGMIDVKDEEYIDFLFIFVRFAYHKSMILKLPFTDMIKALKALLVRKHFTKGSQDADINSHYSLSDWFDDNKDSNEFYLEWLNPGYTQYSCGKWDDGTQSLEDAQKNKLAFYAHRLGIDVYSKGKTLLDLGCGWGGMIFFMAEKFGLKTKGLTLSKAQYEYISKEIKRRNLEDLVEVEIRNIHDIEGKYDYIISVGVMEHIRDFKNLYKKISEALKPEGKALIHSMFHNYPFNLNTDPFISKYIFPGGQIPSIKKNLKVFKKYFEFVDRNDLPNKSYPKTIRCWYDTYCKKQQKLLELLNEKSKVPDKVFALRVFKHYLASVYCGLYEEELVSNILVSN